MFEYWIQTDLTKLPTVKTLGGQVFTADSGANKIGAEVTDNGEPVTLTGTVSANIVKPDGGTISVSGDKSGNRAWVVLPDAAYTATGHIGVYLKLTNGTEVMTLGGVEGYCYRSGAVVT